MNKQQLTRRIILGAIAVSLALPGLRAAAAVEGPMDFGSREDFEDYCENVGGTVEDTGDGNLWCQDFTGGQTVCDTEGNDCYTIPFMPPPPPGPELGGDPAMQGDDPPSGPIDENPTPDVTAPDDEQPQDQPSSKHGKHHKHGKKGGHRGKHGKR